MAQRPRGTRDFAPEEMARRRGAETTLRDVFARFDYREVQTPTFEELDLFTAKSGPGIISELYDFTDKGDRRMTLRPELTAPVMRMYFQDHAFEPKPIKWFYHGPCFRYDRPQEGRYREFWQFGCEQIGAGTPLAYAELIALGSACFDALGIEDLDIRVGHVGVLRAAVGRLGQDDETRAQTMRLIDKGDHEGLANHLQGCPADAIEALTGILTASSIETARESFPHDDLDELEAVMSLLEGFGVKARVDLRVARGLDYYTSIVFEMHTPALEAQSQLLGGGGYDLSHLFGGKQTPTMGFGLGFDRALVALEKQGTAMPAPEGPDVYLGALGDAARDVTVSLAADLRRRGMRVEMDLLGRKPNQIAKHADAVGARRLVMIGDRDLESGTVQVKRLSDGEREDAPLDGLADALAA